MNAGEDEREDRVRVELDPLQRRAPDDREADGAERELEQPLRLDQASDRPMIPNAFCGSP